LLHLQRLLRLGGLGAHVLPLVRTAVAPTWEDIAKLAVIATIRTMLNYFLAKDIAAFDAAKATAQNPPQGPNL
jgi:uncharacterized membrane protein